MVEGNTQPGPEPSSREKETSEGGLRERLTQVVGDIFSDQVQQQKLIDELREVLVPHQKGVELSLRTGDTLDYHFWVQMNEAVRWRTPIEIQRARSIVEAAGLDEGFIRLFDGAVATYLMWGDKDPVSLAQKYTEAGVNPECKKINLADLLIKRPEEDRTQRKEALRDVAAAAGLTEEDIKREILHDLLFMDSSSKYYLLYVTDTGFADFFDLASSYGIKLDDHFDEIYNAIMRNKTEPYRDDKKQNYEWFKGMVTKKIEKSIGELKERGVSTEALESFETYFRERYALEPSEEPSEVASTPSSQG